ncbi:MAG TPA: hypothetical protein PLF40_00980 [Kofleriaceae bacterium]|nr:hypothetical protein [Kofleriaceae bacterium]
MSSTSKWTVAAVAALGLISCSKEKQPGDDLFGKAIAPPGELAKIKAGMTQEDVKKLLPSAKPCERHSGSPCLEISSGFSDVRYMIGFYSDLKTVASIRISSRGGAPQRIAKKAWGPGVADKYVPDEMHWRDETTGFDATIDKRDITFKPFSPLTVAFFGSKPGRVGDWQKVDFGMTQAEVTKLAPDLGRPAPGGTGPDGVSVSPSFNGDDKVERMQLRFPAANKDLVAKAWGPGQVIGAGDDQATYWFDEAGGIRASLRSFFADQAELTMEPYVSYAKLFGEGKDSYGLLPVDQLGKSKADVTAQFSITETSNFVRLPLGLTRYAGIGTGDVYNSNVCNFIYDDKAQCEVSVFYGDATAERDTIMAALKAKWGEPTMKGTDMVFRAAAPNIVVRDENRHVVIALKP